MAANLDTAYIIVTIKTPKTLLAFIDRMLVSAMAYRISACLVFNKVDVYDDEAMETLDEWEDMYQQLGYECIRVSAKTGYNVDVLRNKLKGKVSLFTGNSGVGKSSLINAIDSELGLKTSEVSKSHDKGKHTTTFAEMFQLDDTSYIIDTPGLKGFGLLDMDKTEVSHYFPEMFALLGEC